MECLIIQRHFLKKFFNMIIITRQIGQQKTKKTQSDLDLILSHWKFNNQSIKSAQEFLNNFEPWIDERQKEKKELGEFLKRKKVKNLSEIKDIDPQLAEELKEVKEAKQQADNLVIKIANKLNITKNDPDYTYEGIYRVFEERLAGWQKAGKSKK